MNMIYQKSEGFLHTDTIKVIYFEELQSKILRISPFTNNHLASLNLLHHLGGRATIFYIENS